QGSGHRSGPGLRSAADARDQLSKPGGAVLERPALVGEVDVNQTEPPAEPEAPLEVVEQRPDVVAAQWHAGRPRLAGRRDVAREVGHATVIPYAPAGIDGVWIGGPILADDELVGRVFAIQCQQDVAEAVGRDLPAHLGLLGAGACADLPVERPIRERPDRIAAVVVHAEVVKIARWWVGQLEPLGVAGGPVR